MYCLFIKYCKFFAKIELYALTVQIILKNRTAHIFMKAEAKDFHKVCDSVF